MADTLFYDGIHALQHNVTLAHGIDALGITSITMHDNGEIPHVRAEWRYEDITVIFNPHDGFPIRLGNKQNPQERLELYDRAIWKRINENLQLHQAGTFHIPAHFSIIIGFLAISVILLIGAYYAVPHVSSKLAPYVPEHIKRDISNQAIAIFNNEDTSCHSEEGDAALSYLQAQLTKAHFSEYPHDFIVIPHEMSNAFTLPDDRIIIFDGLLQNATSPDELSGVLAHELGHVKHNHASEGLVQILGGRLVFLIMFGGSTSIDSTQLLQHFLQSGYRRDMERQADHAAITILRDAQLENTGLVNFFKKMSEKEGTASEILSYISTHPSSAERVDTMTAAIAKEDYPIRPTLSDAQWNALRNICSNITQSSDQ